VVVDISDRESTTGNSSAIVSEVVKLRQQEVQRVLGTLKLTRLVIKEGMFLRSYLRTDGESSSLGSTLTLSSHQTGIWLDWVLLPKDRRHSWNCYP
jgi:hypothetical protein